MEKFTSAQGEGRNVTFEWLTGFLLVKMTCGFLVVDLWNIFFVTNEQSTSQIQVIFASMRKARCKHLLFVNILMHSKWAVYVPSILDICKQVAGSLQLLRAPTGFQIKETCALLVAYLWTFIFFWLQMDTSVLAIYLYLTQVLPRKSFQLLASNLYINSEFFIRCHVMN